MYKNISNKIHRESIKNKNLNIFTEWYLNHRGKKDCKKEILRKVENNQYVSPFLVKEIRLCSFAIQKEQEILIKIISDIQSEIKIAFLRIAEKKQKSTNIGETDNSNHLKNLRLYGEETIDDDIIASYRNNEINTLKNIKNKQLQSINISIEKLVEDKQRYISLIEKEVEITRLRCKQRYDILVARLYAYWNGVLSCTPNSQEIHPTFDIEYLFSDIKYQIENLAIGDTYNVEK